MSKTNLTKEIEERLHVFYSETHHCAEEVTLPEKLEVYTKKSGKEDCRHYERIDFVACRCGKDYQKRNKIFVCIEIKISKTDFFSDCANSFVGNKNYYAMPQKLYDEVMDSIPAHVGVLVPHKNSMKIIKQARVVKMQIPQDVLLHAMLRSCYRDVKKTWYKQTCYKCDNYHHNECSIYGTDIDKDSMRCRHSRPKIRDSRGK